MTHISSVKNLQLEWLAAEARRKAFARSLETEDLADQELDTQMELLAAIANVKVSSIPDVLLKLELWKASVYPGETVNCSLENKLVFSAIEDLQLLVSPIDSGKCEAMTPS